MVLITFFQPHQNVLKSGKHCISHTTGVLCITHANTPIVNVSDWVLLGIWYTHTHMYIPLGLCQENSMTPCFQNPNLGSGSTWNSQKAGLGLSAKFLTDSVCELIHDVMQSVTHAQCSEPIKKQ